MLNRFRIPFEKHVLVGDLSSEPCTVLVLHGAGTSNRGRFERLRRRLHAEGIPTCSFDFIGHGETGGELGSSSLKQRTEQASRVIEACLQEPLTLVGASMSGYTAVRLTRLHQVRNLVLIVPAMYTPDAYEVPFKGDFSEIIRSRRSWERSEAWQILAGFTGNLLVVACRARHGHPARGGRADIPECFPGAIAGALRGARGGPHGAVCITDRVRQGRRNDQAALYGVSEELVPGRLGRDRTEEFLLLRLALVPGPPLCYVLTQ